VFAHTRARTINVSGSLVLPTASWQLSCEVGGGKMGISISEVPAEKRGLWTTEEVRRDEQGNLTLLRISSRWGELQFGARSDGGVGWIFKEEGGGGSVVIPYSRSDSGELLVGLVREHRPNMADVPTLCAVGGFRDPGESHFTAGTREAAEEAPELFQQLEKAKELSGLPFISNRFYFEADLYAGEGVHAFGLWVPTELLRSDSEGDLRIAIAGGGKTAEVVFLPWRQAIAKCGDGLALSAIARLLAALS